MRRLVGVFLTLALLLSMVPSKTAAQNWEAEHLTDWKVFVDGKPLGDDCPVYNVNGRLIVWLRCATRFLPGADIGFEYDQYNGISRAVVTFVPKYDVNHWTRIKFPSHGLQIRILTALT